jgi:alkanesulfonate monooxygenase SsuD/methylene tetrahydromethanopterin reductase-like flavin-dependent oxidoreductase (luciferase family)
MHLGVSLTPFGHHPNAWRLAASPETLGFAALLAQVTTAETAGCAFVVLSDRLGQRPRETLSPLAAPFEPTTLVAALSTCARAVGFFAAASTCQHEPYNLARRFASLDLISHGRTGWTIVGDARAPDRDREYIDVVSGLWDSWEDDAFIYDKVGGRFFSPEKMHGLNHAGANFSVRGPLNVNRSPQGKPVLAGIATGDAASLAARSAEVIFVQDGSPRGTGTGVADLVTSLASHGRRRSDVRIFADVMPFIGATRAEAQAAFDRLQEDDPDRTSQTIDAPVLVGTVGDVAEALQHWFGIGDVDGFTLLPPTTASLVSIADTLLPELQKRELVRTGISGSTLRHRLDLPHPIHPTTRLEPVA